MRAGLLMTGFALLLAGCGQGGEEKANVASGDTNVAASASSGSLATILGSDQRFAGLVQAAGMNPVLEGKEPYTVLAPTAEALQALPSGTLERLQQPAARAELTALLRRHILPGTIMAADLNRAVETGQGKATLASMAGDPLTVTREGQTLVIADSSGAKVRLVGNEEPASNGVVHRIDAVLPAPDNIGSGTN